MSRYFMALAACLFAAALPMQARAQTAASGFSGMCAYYPGKGSGFTAAHPTLPFGTRVRVTDPTTGHSVVVVISDRGPFGGKRVLDVSTNAARALGMTDRGVIFVVADVL